MPENIRHCKRPHHRKCPKHSHWAPCGLSCPKTCAHPHGPLKCPLSCRPGCKCDKDYVRRNSDGTGPCVRRRHCKRPHHRKCPKHSHWAPYCKNHHKKGPKKGPKKHHKKGHKKD
ncbi:hypothetical protein SSS_10529 [Sarcoptes scabiei]|nr:hypothetical protein SSS_10529 [Sarcoptes scabiei]